MTTYVVYSLDSAIRNFFSTNTTVTRQQCDDFAVSRAGGVSTALQMQGVCSYTVTAGPEKSRLFQFRDEDSPIDIHNIRLARVIHSEFVFACEYLGTIGESRPLYVYEMENLPGTAYIMARISPDDMSRQRATIKDLARFFAQAWNHAQRPSSDRTAILLAEFQSSFELLARDLPSRFASNLEKVRNDLPSLFSNESIPFVLSHGDLNEMNLLVNPATGNITGIVDWTEAGILPFGFALYGLENLLGRMDSGGWHYYAHHRELEGLFWQILREEARDSLETDMHFIRIARMAGLFSRYGFHFDARGAVQRVRMEPEDSLAYLDAFCAGEWLG
ncbi:hypothetical protein POX_g08602 [Penicillium oxalicum]|uniref:hypothetical protein n=1 Tax=Penicillium oxalicum TaxID=69781 RepID=UPI0020B79534|nr:hypothetical protein POX_g08602 [Penicillium oxalicum]KAI2786220.1 hypothetical protein POX_g08602 [Penicillium oxalicum]